VRWEGEWFEAGDVSKGGREAERMSVIVQDAPGQSSNSRISGRKRKQTEFYTAAVVDRTKTTDASGNAQEDTEGGHALADDWSLGPDSRDVMVQALQGDCIAAAFLANAITSASGGSDPNSRMEAMASPDWPKWAEAEREELAAMRRLEVISEPVPRPSDVTVVKTKWLYKTKSDKDGNIVKYKARLVGQGYSQIFGKDYYDTYAPVARLSSLRLVYSLSVVYGAELYMLDVNTAFLNASLKEDVYINPPAGYGDIPKGYVLKLQKALYGLKQSPREWNNMVNDFLVSQCKFVRLQTEHCVYIRHFADSTWLICLLYVDDIIVAYTNPDRFVEFKTMLLKRFECKDIGRVTSALNIEVFYPKGGGVFLCQTKYINDLVQRFSHIIDNLSHSVTLPHDYHLKYCKDGLYSTDPVLLPDNVKCDDSVPYRELLGALLWLSEGTRPDIKYIVSAMSKYLNEPRVAQWKALKKVLRYLNGTKKLGIHYRQMPKAPKCPLGYVSSSHFSMSNLRVDGYVDSDFANNVDDRRSITGYVYFMAGGPVSWQSHSQKTVALSSMEAEYMALAAATQEALWLKMILEELQFLLQTPMRLLEDNVACIHFADHPGEHRRSKHIDYKYHFVRERVKQGDIQVDSVKSQDNVADLFTKALPRDLFVKLRGKLLVDGQQLQLK